MIRAILSLAFLGLAAAWTGGGYYDRYSVAPMRADQDSVGFGSLFEANRRQFQNSRMNTSGEYTRYRNDGMDYYPRYNDGYGYNSYYRNYNDYDYGYGGNSGRYLTRYRPNRNRYYNGYDYDYGYNNRHWDDRDYSGGSYNYGYSNRYNNRYGSRYGDRYNNDYWSYSQTPRSYNQGGYGPNYDSYRYY